MIESGASPRASIALILCAKANAFLDEGMSTKRISTLWFFLSFAIESFYRLTLHGTMSPAIKLYKKSWKIKNNYMTSASDKTWLEAVIKHGWRKK